MHAPLRSERGRSELLNTRLGRLESWIFTGSEIWGAGRLNGFKEFGEVSELCLFALIYPRTPISPILDK